MATQPNDNSKSKPDYAKPDYSKKKFIVVDGLIGAGKTTLINLLTEKYNKSGEYKVCPILEPVDIWRDTGALAHFYKDIDAHAYEFQTFAFVTRIKRVLDILESNPDADIYILERSIFTDRFIFVEMLKDKFGPTRMKMYDMWWDMWSRLLPININTWIYLDTSLEEANRRICMRDRTEESAVSLDYQRALQQTHINFFDQLKTQGKHVIIIEPGLMDTNFIENPEVLDNIASRILIT